MPRRSQDPPLRRSTRRWCAERALLGDPAFPEPYEGAAMLTEVGGELGLSLWQTCRDVLLWAGAEADQRATLFSAGSLASLERLLAAVGDVPLRSSLRQVAQLLRNDGDGAAADRQRSDRSARLRLTHCCEVVVDWATRAGHEWTAIAFAQAAALASPADPLPYLRAGRLLYRHRRYTAAGTWFRRTISLARNAGDKRSLQCYGEAWLELGRLYASKGDTNAARRYFVRAHTFARRAGLRKLRGHARHGLMRAAMAGDDYGAALHHGTMALREFRHDRERVDVVHDCAAVLLRQNPVDNAAACLGMLWEIIPSRRAGAERIASLLLVVRAAAVTGAADMLADAWFDAVHSIDLLGESCGSARLLLDLARAGSEAPGIDPARADEVARRAFNMAARVNDRAVALQADELRRELAGRGAP